MLPSGSRTVLTVSSRLAGCQFFHDRSAVPRVVDDREKKHAKTPDAGYVFRYHRQGLDPLPRIPDNRVPVARPAYKVRDAWRESQARFGENDYIDLLGDGRLHPAQLQYHAPTWLRGFPGQHKANELVKLIHYRNLYKEKLKNNSPRRWHELCKRIKYLLMQHNYNKQDELGRERDLGLWDEEPDYFYKDKARRSFKDHVRDSNLSPTALPPLLASPRSRRLSSHTTKLTTITTTTTTLITPTTPASTS